MQAIPHGEVPYLMPDADLVRWSETVARWNCNRDAEFFISISDVCQAIKSDDGNLHAFLQLMNDGGNGKVMEDYALLPNRNGELCCKDKLFHADFLTTDVFNLVSVLMGDDTKKILNAYYHDVCKVSTYLKEDLQRAISGNMSNWREKTITSSNPVLLTDDELSALIKFCSSTCQSEFRCMRADIMPLVAEFFGKPGPSRRHRLHRRSSQSRTRHRPERYLLQMYVIKIIKTQVSQASTC